MGRKWTLDDIDWSRFDPEKVDHGLLAVIKTASLVEANSADYVTYLKNVFPDDVDFHTAAEQWGVEEAQHGAALGRWAECADPDFSFEESLERFRDGFQVPINSEQSIRGSRAGELIARSVVESGTSSFYSAIRDATDEPVLKDICKRIATDEFFHYQLFQKHLKRYEIQDRLPVWSRLKVAFSRLSEVTDDELAYAYYSANIAPTNPQAPYSTQDCSNRYHAEAMSLYRERHIDTAARMILRAADVNPNGKVGDIVAKAGWQFLVWRRNKIQDSIAGAR